MSSFTRPLSIIASPYEVRGWRRYLPPGFHRPRWEVAEGFSYAVGCLESPEGIIEVPAGFTFDGASVPLPFRVLVPMAHPEYIQATALHDYMLITSRRSRLYCDQVFFEALGVLGLSPLWQYAMYIAVRLRAWQLFVWGKW